MQIEVWWKCWCPECKAINWVCNGDEQDSDVEAVACYKCDAVTPVSEFLEGDPEDWNYEHGCSDPTFKA